MVKEERTAGGRVADGNDSGEGDVRGNKARGAEVKRALGFW